MMDAKDAKDMKDTKDFFEWNPDTTGLLSSTAMDTTAMGSPQPIAVVTTTKREDTFTDIKQELLDYDERMASDDELDPSTSADSGNGTCPLLELHNEPEEEQSFLRANIKMSEAMMASIAQIAREKVAQATPPSTIPAATPRSKKSVAKGDIKVKVSTCAKKIKRSATMIGSKFKFFNKKNAKQQLHALVIKNSLAMLQDENLCINVTQSILDRSRVQPEVTTIEDDDDDIIEIDCTAGDVDVKKIRETNSTGANNVNVGPPLVELNHGENKKDNEAEKALGAEATYTKISPIPWSSSCPVNDGVNQITNTKRLGGGDTDISEGSVQPSDYTESTISANTTQIDTTQNPNISATTRDMKTKENDDKLEILKVDQLEKATEMQNKEDNTKTTDTPVIKNMKINPKNLNVDSVKEKKHNVWIYNINRNTRAEQLKIEFKRYSKVNLVKIVTNGDNYFGYAVLDNDEQVQRSIKNLSGIEIDGNIIDVSTTAPSKRVVNYSPGNTSAGEIHAQKELPKSSKNTKGNNSKDGNTGRTKCHRPSTPDPDPLTLKFDDKNRKNQKETPSSVKSQEIDALNAKKQELAIETRKAEVEIETERRRLLQLKQELQRDKMRILAMQKKVRGDMQRVREDEEKRLRKIHLEHQERQQKYLAEKRQARLNQNQSYVSKSKYSSSHKDNKSSSKKRHGDDYDSRKYHRSRSPQSPRNKHRFREHSSEKYKGSRARSRENKRSTAVAPQAPRISQDDKWSNNKSNEMSKKKDYYRSKQDYASSRDYKKHYRNYSPPKQRYDNSGPGPSDAYNKENRRARERIDTNKNISPYGSGGSNGYGNMNPRPETTYDYRRYDDYPEYRGYNEPSTSSAGYNSHAYQGPTHQPYQSAPIQPNTTSWFGNNRAPYNMNKDYLQHQYPSTSHIPTHITPKKYDDYDKRPQYFPHSNQRKY